MSLVHILEKSVKHQRIKRDNEEVELVLTKGISFQINTVLSRKALIM